MTADHAGQTGGERERHPADPMAWMQEVHADRVWCSHCGEPTPCRTKVAVHEASDAHRQYCIPVSSCYLTCQPIPSRPVPVAGQAASERNVIGRPDATGDQTGQAAREAAVEAVARWLALWDANGAPTAWTDEPQDDLDRSIRDVYLGKGRELLSLPEVAALSAAPGQEQGR